VGTDLASEHTVLEGWTALPEAAAMLNLTKQGLHFRVNQGKVPTKFVREVRTGTRKLVLISNEYLEEETTK
jgi:hypothetical protein